MKKLAVMGGTFNPIHVGHLQMADAAVCKFGCDNVLFMTAGNPPHKHSNHILDAHIRFEMTHLAIKGDPRFFDSDYEVQKKGYSYTAQTMEMLSEQYPDTKMYFVIGSDSLADLLLWKDPDKLFSITQFLVFPRKGLDVPIDELTNKYRQMFGAKITNIPYPVANISSTYLREQMALGNWENISPFIPSKVFSYIKMHGLYS